MFDAQSFLEDYNIPFAVEGKNTQTGWVNIDCPFPNCNDTSNHGGFNLSKSYYNCWKCGFHYLNDTISILINVSRREADSIIKEYDIHTSQTVIKESIKNKRGKLELPKGTAPLQFVHKQYLRKRNFVPEELVVTWDLQGVWQFGDYKYRIIAPIYYNNKLVSYQGRDITDRSPYRYKACAKKNELIHHKYILYGLDYVQNMSMIIVEGITDVWRLGKGAVALFGVGYTIQQIRMIKKKAKKVFILFDYAATEQADKLSWELAILGISVEIINAPFTEDPGSMKQEDADYIKKQLLGGI